MSDLEVILIIALVIGVIASNLAVLKYSAKFKMTQFGHKPKGTQVNLLRPNEPENDTEKAVTEKKATDNSDADNKDAATQDDGVSKDGTKSVDGKQNH
ncbi:DUF2897 family protein [Shewanella sp. SNU WT4]|uniref:DUF2897 family protein n=1 Tax=Shewanella sp. SNU WT4 TaxID=2590015 RepID=UPI001F0D65B5|nr:DUF2897 family protein [Shewanella sp. SNU WT4]